MSRSIAQTTAYSPELFAPRWTLRTVLLAATVTLGLYLMLPYLETLTQQPEQDLTLRHVDTAILTPPPPPPPRVFEDTRPKLKAPKPKLEMPKQKLNPLASALNLEMALGDIGGDFSVSFAIRDDELAGQLEDIIFEIGDLDEPPRPLSRLQPIYPQRARVRRIQGEVVVEFIVAPDGSVRDAVVVSAQPGEIFSDAALRAVRRWRFSPGQKSGKAVSVRVRQKLNFSLN